MGVDEYLSETGGGRYRKWHVPDLVPRSTQDTKILFVFESPHVDELAARIPVVGGAGQSALRYLLGATSLGDSLGSYVKLQHAAGNHRVAILNVSGVPMQVAAFQRMTAPGLSPSDWALVEKVRTSQANSVNKTRDVAANHVGDRLLRSLQARVDALQLRPDCTIIAGGVFARRFVRSLHGLPGPKVLEVLHPSRHQWIRNPDDLDLPETRRLFLQHQRLQRSGLRDARRNRPSSPVL